MRIVALALVIVLVAPAAADEDQLPVTVEVGKTVTKEVGFAMGYLCDDESIARGEMRNGTDENNIFAVTGVKPGTTLCRAGTVRHRPTVLFTITVVAPAPPPRTKR